MDIINFKEQFNQGSSYIHLNNAGQAPIPEVNHAVASQWLNKFYSEAAHCSIEGWKEVETTRKKLADFISCSAGEISFFQTTASAISQIALSIPLLEGDEIITWDQEYPSNFYPWRMAAEKNKARIVQVKSDNYLTPFENLLAHVTEKTRVIAISWVQYQTGSVTDLKQLAQALSKKDIWLVADVIQGLGVRPLNFRESGFDVVCSGSHKWLCSSYGAAFLAIKSERIHQLLPIEYGAMTFGTPDTEKSFKIESKKTAAKFEPGSKSMIEIIALGASLDLFSKVGMNNIYSEANRLSQKLRQGLSAQGHKVFNPQEGPIINFKPTTDQQNFKITQNFKNEKISFALRGPGIRLSVHAFIYDKEIEKVLELTKINE